MTSQHTADYPTLQEVLRLPVFAGCTVCGGAAGLGRRVSGVNLTDTPDYARWLAQGELLITTGFAIADDPQAVDALLPTAAEKGLSGVGIKPGRYLPGPLPAALAEKADRLGLPLLQLPTDMRFAELADAVPRDRTAANTGGTGAAAGRITAPSHLWRAAERSDGASGGGVRYPFGMSAYPDVDTG